MDAISLIKSPILPELETFKSLFDETLTGNNPLLNKVLAHICQRNGKMMRPILVLLIARLYGTVCPATLHAAAALELLHTASLVHDDVVDESTKRRGQLSANAVFNNKVSVLSGDYLLASALVHAERTKSGKIVEIVARLGQDLADGELLQLFNVGTREFSEKAYFDVIHKKTAVLFVACAEAAAHSVDASPEQIDAACRLGECIGLCFQIKDDIFDYFEDTDIGKPTGNDMLEGKLTLPVLHALNSTADAEAAAIALRVRKGEATAEEITRLVAFTKANDGIEYAVRVMDDYKKKALRMLDEQPEGPVRDALRAYVEYVAERKL